MIRYIPVVRTKAGEADALGNLSAQARSKILPLIRLTGTVPATFQSRMIAAINRIPVALDGIYNFSATGSTVVYNSLFHGLGMNGISVIPTISLFAHSYYNNTAIGLIGHYGPGCVLHVSLADVAQATGWVTALGRGDDLTI